MERSIPVPLSIVQGMLSLLAGTQLAQGPIYHAFRTHIEEWETKEPHVCITRADAEQIVNDLNEAGKFDNAEALEFILTGGHTFELEPTRESLGSDIVRCEEHAAEKWSIYKRPRNPDSRGNQLAVWVADFALHDRRAAEITVKSLNERSDL